MERGRKEDREGKREGWREEGRKIGRERGRGGRRKCENMITAGIVVGGHDPIEGLTSRGLMFQC